MQVALKLVPDTDTFISLLMDKGQNIDTFKDEIQAFISLLVPLLEDLHSTLVSINYSHPSVLNVKNYSTLVLPMFLQ